MFTKKILAAAIKSQPSANGVADAIDFDGTNDYLSRSSDLVGNTDGKTFTFSAWVWLGETPTAYVMQNDSGRFYIQVSQTQISVSADNTSGTNVLRCQSILVNPPKNTFLHILVSVDLSDTAKRFVYVNDTIVSPTWTTYANSAIDFTATAWGCSAASGGGSNFKGRLSHIFLDYTYRDLSIEANRRLFITADRKPTPKATLQALNPIIYLKMDDPTQAGKNLGTGGDFTLNGVVARSGRGPNQFNAAYSDLDGSTDYLSRTSALAGVANSKLVTLCFCFEADAGFVSGERIIAFRDASNLQIFQVSNQSGKLRIVADSVPNTADALVVELHTIVANRNYVVAISFDLSDTSKRHAYVNGESVAAVWSTYANLAIAFSSASLISIGSSQTIAASLYDGRLGNVFFDTRYIDLSVPANLAKFVTGTGIDAKPVDLGANGELPFGTPPLIYLPMYGNNAGKNYGTGGDFTVNSGPFTGARGPNEFWGNKADFDGSTGYLSRTSALSGVSDGKTFSCVVWFQLDATGVGHVPFSIGDSNNLEYLYIRLTGSNTLQVSGRNSSGTVVLNTSISGTYTTATTYCLMISVDLTSTSNRSVYVNNVLQTVSWNTYTNSNIKFSDAYCTIGAIYNGSGYGNYMNGKLSEFYLTTDYIDFSQEANRLKFRDAFGNPVDLRPQIAAGTLPNPAIYMRFDPANFGKNSGTGGDFVVNGTITDGGQL